MTLRAHPSEDAEVDDVQVTGKCPHCSREVTFSKLPDKYSSKLAVDRGLESIIVGYCCDGCRQPVAIEWEIEDPGEYPFIRFPKCVTPTKPTYNFDFVPESVTKEIEEALACYSVGAYNGFAAMCRRSLQAMYASVRPEGKESKVGIQIRELIEVLELDEEDAEAVRQVMLAGHDGAHPNLLEIDADRAELLLQVMQIVTERIFTNPGKVGALREKRRR